jgi:hypothetical protein
MNAPFPGAYMAFAALQDIAKNSATQDIVHPKRSIRKSFRENLSHDLACSSQL